MVKLEQIELFVKLNERRDTLIVETRVGRRNYLSQIVRRNVVGENPEKFKAQVGVAEPLPAVELFRYVGNRDGNV